MPRKQPRLRVTKTGTLIVPKSIVQKVGAQPGDFVELGDVALRHAGMTRKAFLKLLVGGGAAIGWIANFIQIGTFFQNEHRQATETDTRLVDQLFSGVGDSKIALAPARHHPFRPLGDDDPIYPIEAECCRAYLDRFTESYEERSANGIPDIQPGDNVVLFGSQVSNLVTRDILGNPFNHEVRSKILYRSHGRVVGHVPLRWNLRMDARSPVKVRPQYGIAWEFHEHVFHDFQDQVDLTLDDPQKEDLLLVTSVPRPGHNRVRLLIFSGLHGPGTLATALLLREPPLGDLRRLSADIGRKAYYQALFRVKVQADSKTAEPQPRSLELLDAQQLAWRLGSGGSEEDLVGTIRAEGTRAGIELEEHLHRVARDRSVKIERRNPTIGDLNDLLRKADVYDVATWRKIQFLADVRNLCAHKKNVQPTEDQVAELITGVDWVKNNVL